MSECCLRVLNICVDCSCCDLNFIVSCQHIGVVFTLANFRLITRLFCLLVLWVGPPVCLPLFSHMVLQLEVQIASLSSHFSDSYPICTTSVIQVDKLPLIPRRQGLTAMFTYCHEHATVFFKCCTGECCICATQVLSNNESQHPLHLSRTRSEEHWLKDKNFHPCSLSFSTLPIG